MELLMQPAFEFDTATVLNKGQRHYQEDAVITDFSRGSEVGVVVLADGMGGHAAGDVASKIVVSEVFTELLFQRCDLESFKRHAPQKLTHAALAANACLKEHVAAYPDTRGMGATLVAGLIMNRQLYWISIGDSPFFLFRDGALLQLNEDHSMAPQIDFMARSGLLSKEEAARHPDRNTLTSVLFGEEIPKIDCPQDPLVLEEGDVLIVASDGLQFLSDNQIRSVLLRHQHLASTIIANALLHETLQLNDPDLDNLSFSVIKVDEAQGAPAQQIQRAVTASDIRRVG